MRVYFSGAVVVAGWLMVSGLCHASDFPDLVRLKNGGMLRGTIIEYVPGDHVLIQLPNGEQRNVPGADIEAAGPDQPAPAPPPAAPAPGSAMGAGQEPPLVPIEAVNTGKGTILFHVRNPHGMFEQICVAPCKAALPAGAHKMALSLPDGKTIPQKGLVTVTEPSVLEGKYSAASGTRSLGWLLLAVGAGTMAAAPFVAHESETADGERDVLAGMVIGGAVGVCLGLALGLTRDKADVTVRPGGLPRPVPPPRGAFRGPYFAGAVTF